MTGQPDIGLSVLEVMDENTKAVLMKNHGLISFGRRIDEAMLYSEIIEKAAKVYINALAANGGREPALAPEHLIPAMQGHFNASYGQPK